MKKKQLFAGALAAAMMTASLAGCGGAASSAEMCIRDRLGTHPQGAAY